MSDDRSCPLGHTCNRCKWHIQIMGKDPNSGQDINRRDCAISWLPTLLIDGAMRQHQTNAAVDKLHNAVVGSNDNFQQLLFAAASNRQEKLE